MARKELGPTALLVAQAVAQMLSGDAVVGVSGGADSMALAMGAHWAARRNGVTIRCVVVDHGLQPDSNEVARRVVADLVARGLDAQLRHVEVRDTGEGIEAAARQARLEVLAGYGADVLLGHTQDDDAEQVLLGLLRGSGTRSLAGIPPRRGPFVRPLLGLRRAHTEQACREWNITWWQDPMNQNPVFARVAVRQVLKLLATQLGRDLIPALARTARLARMDADHLDAEAARIAVADELEVADVEHLDDAVRLRVVQRWLRSKGLTIEFSHVDAVDQLITAWCGQGPIHVPGAHVVRRQGVLIVQLRPGLPAVGE